MRNAARYVRVGLGRGCVPFGLLVGLTLFSPCVALAQNTLAGIVHDASGGVLPGVTIEATSPSLIEKLRTTTTDSQGLYQIADLRPGTYAITFTLAGFTTVKRENVLLGGSQTSTVNVELRLGTLEETITVSGDSPIVDVQTVSQRRALPAEVIDALPSARNFQSLAALIPGVTASANRGGSPQDVGGLAGERNRLAIHGGRLGDFNSLLDGLSFTTLSNEGAGTHYNVNPAEVQEFGYETASNSTQNPTGGVRMNVVPKEGGNLFKGSFFTNFTNPSLQSENLTDDLRQRGLTTQNRIVRLLDVNPSLGGPLKNDKLWFFAAARYLDFSDFTGGRPDTNLSDFVYTPGPEVANKNWSLDTGVRLTWQAAERHKVSFYGSYQDRCTCAKGTPLIATEAIANGELKGVKLFQLSWSSPLSSKLFLEAGYQRLDIGDSNEPQEGVLSDHIRIVEQTTGFAFRAAELYNAQTYGMNMARAALSYITGSHNFKVGLDFKNGSHVNNQAINGDMFFRVANGVPNQVTLFTTPYAETYTQNAAFGFYAQDLWTIRRLTVTGGLRFDYHNTMVPAISIPARRFVGPREFAEVNNVPNWTDVSPRLGVAYNLFGTGRTAIKASLNRYVASEGEGLASGNNPIRASVLTATRTWNDSNGDWQPQESELGPLSNAGFGQPRVVTRYDPEVTEGCGSRGYNWESTLGVQHELFTGMSVDATYVRRWWGNQLVTDNLAIGPGDYDPFCITAPLDSRLPGGGGNQVCGLYDINPAARAVVPDSVVTLAKNYGDQSEKWTGVDLNFNARLPRSVLIAGGLSTGKTDFDNCDVAGLVDNPAAERGNASNVWTVAGPSALYCHQEISRTYVKFLGSTRLPWDVEFSATYQNLPGPEIRAQWAVPNASIARSLGRNLSAGANGTVLVDLIAPGTMFSERINQIDLRFGRALRIGHARIKGMVDVYNVLNSSAALIRNNTYGPAWEPTYIMPARLVKIGVQIDF